MKKTFYFLTLIAVFAFISCRKEKDTIINNDSVSVKYDFTTDRAGNFTAEYSIDSSYTGEAITSLTWSKTVIISKQNATSRTLNFTIHPPFEWTSTTDQANVTIKISVDGVEKSSNSGVMGGIDHPVGLTTTTDL